MWRRWHRPSSGRCCRRNVVECKARWDTVFTWDDERDVDLVGDSRSFQLGGRNAGPVRLRAVVFARAPAEEDRSYKLNVRPLTKPT